MREKIVTTLWRLLVCPSDALGHAAPRARGPKKGHLQQYSLRDLQFAPGASRQERNEGSARRAMNHSSFPREALRKPGRDIGPQCHRSQGLGLPDPHFGRSELQGISKPWREQPWSLARAREASQSCPFRLEKSRARSN